MKFIALSLAGIALVVLSGCKSGSSSYGQQFQPASTHLANVNHFTSVAFNENRQELLQPPTENYTVGPGDQLEIQVLGDPTTRETVLVGPDGKIYFYLLPGIDVWGLTLAQVREKIQEGLMNYLRGESQVSVTLRQAGSKQVWLLGRFESPGIYPLNGPMTLLEAIAEAGGPASPSSVTSGAGGPLGISISGDIADLHRSFVMRQGRVLPVDFYRLLKQGDMSQNIYLQPDDFVYMPSSVAKEVYVLGAVGDPTSVSYNNEISLIGAIAAARGTIGNAYLSHVAIVRGTLSSPQIAIVNYRDIIKGKSPNVLLEPGDIVYVPFTPYRVLQYYADLILKTFVQTVAVNEGARAVSRNAGVVGVAIPSGGGGVLVGGGGGTVGAPLGGGTTGGTTGGGGGGNGNGRGGG